MWRIGNRKKYKDKKATLRRQESSFVLAMWISSDYSDDDDDEVYVPPVEEYDPLDAEERKLIHERFKEEVEEDFRKQYPHLENLEAKGVSYMRDLSQTIIFPLVSDIWTSDEDGERVPDKYMVELFAVDSEDGTLYQLTSSCTVDYQYVDCAMDGETVYLTNSGCGWGRSPKKVTPEILTYNLLTRHWNSEHDPGNVMEIKSRLWPHGHPAFESTLSMGCTRCVVDNVAFSFQIKDAQPFLSVASIAQDDANFVSHHTIKLDRWLKGFCGLEYPRCFLNHITGFKFCLLIFFAYFFDTYSVGILTLELVKEPALVRIEDDPDQSKARKRQTYRFAIKNILNRRAFKLPSPESPIICVKQENDESRKYQLF